MTPTTDERLASVVRSLTEVILPHLPPEASLAQEQVQLAIGHLQILRAQLDAIPAFEREELDDAMAIARAVADVVAGGAVTTQAVGRLQSAIAASDYSDVRGQAGAINAAIDALVKAVVIDGAVDAKQSLSKTILSFEHDRVQKDRAWFMPFGFDTIAQAQ